MKITDSVYYVGVLNPNLRVFDIIMKTEFGTSYNSYIVKGKEKTALIEASHLSFSDYFVNNIKDVCDITKIDYIILNHNEPDHSGNLVKLVELIPDVTVIVSQAGAIYLKNITNRTDLNIKIVKDNDTLDLGDRVLKFINAPFLHWPDSMFTWDETDGILFSCDFLGAHFCEPQIIDKNITYTESYKKALLDYFNAIFSPFKSYVKNGLEKIKDLPIKYAATSHGPVLTKEGLLDYAIDCYHKWSEPVVNEKKKIPIFYCSAYGNTEILAEEIKKGIISVIPDAQVNTYDIIKNDMSSLSFELNTSDAFCIGSPTLNRDAVAPVWQLLSHVDVISNQNKKCAVFGSYGWSGEAALMIRERLKLLKMNVFENDCRVVFVPSEQEKKSAFEFGKSFGDCIK